MRYILLVLLGLCVATPSQAQKSKDRHERDMKMAEAKKEYISTHLEMSDDEKKAFVPLYDKYLKSKLNIYLESGKLRTKATMPDASEQEGEDALAEYLRLRREEVEQYEAFVNELSQILPAKKILHLEGLEREFNRKAIKSVRKRKSREKRDGNRP